jgi:HIRAN domain-containing protein
VRHFFADVAGESYPNSDGSDRLAIIQKCTVGELLVLEDEPDNPADINAIGVLRESGEQIGYLPRDMAAEVVSRSAKGWQYHAAIAGLGRAHGHGPYGVALLVVVDEAPVERLTLSNYVAAVLAAEPEPRQTTPSVVQRDVEFERRVYRAVRSVEAFENHGSPMYVWAGAILAAIVAAIILVLAAG